MLPAIDGSAWSPPVEGAIAELVDSVVLDIAEKLVANTARPIPGLGGAGSILGQNSAHSLASGNAGFAIFFEHLDRCYPGNGWELIAKLQLQRAATAFAEAPCESAALFDGTTGLAFATSYLSRNGNRYRALTNTIDAITLSHAAAAVAGIPSAVRGVPTSYFDVVSGLSGICAYLLCRVEDDAHSALLQETLDALVRLTEPSEPYPKWHTPPDCMVGTLANAYPGGFLDCGLAHGISGPLAIMSLSRAQGIETPGLDTGIAAIADWLVAQIVHDDWGINWPAAVPLESSERTGFGLRPPAFSKEKPTKTAWCYGAPGVANSLWLAGTAIHRPDWIACSIEAMVAVVSKPRAKRYINSYAHICHGLGGLLLITLLFHHRTGLKVFRSAAHELAEELLALYEAQSDSGFVLVEFDGTRRHDFGLLEGSAGAALALMAFRTREPPIWSRMFALA